MDVPNHIKEIAYENGCNSVEFVKNINGIDYYSIGLLDDNGMFVPTGLPEFIVVNGDDIKIISGNEGLELCSILYD